MGHSTATSPVLPPRVGRTPAAFATALVLLLGLGLTAVAWNRALVAQAEELQADFDFRLRDAGARVEARMMGYEQVLRGAGALFGASDRVTRAGFRTYVASLRLQERFPGIQGLGFEQVIPSRQLAQHEAELRSEGFTGYAVRPPGPREPYSAVVFLEPFTGRNLSALGYDGLAEPTRRAALEKARDVGDAALSARVTLVQETNQAAQAGVLLYLPVYAGGATPASLEARRQALVGWVYMPFRMGDLMDGILGERGQDLAFQIHDGPEPADATLMFDSEPVAPPSGRFQGWRTVPVVDRTWTIAVHSRAPFDARLATWKPRLVGLAGLALSVLLAALVWVLATGRDRAVDLAAQTNQLLLATNSALTESEARFRGLVENLPAGVVVHGRDSAITFANPRACALLGLSRGQLGGRLAADPGWRFVRGDGSPLPTAEFPVRHVLDTGRQLVDLVVGIDRPSPLPRAWVLVNAFPNLDAARQLAQVVVTFVDVTEQVSQSEWLEEARREAQRQATELQGLLDAVPAAVYITRDLTARHMKSNRFGAELLRVPQGSNVSRTAPADEGPARFTALRDGRALRPEEMPVQRAAATGQAVTGFEFELITHDGRVRHLVGNASPLPGPQGEPAGAVGAFIDVTEGRLAALALRASEARLKAALEEQSVILENATVGITLVKGRTQIWSSAHMQRMFGYGAEELRGAPTRLLYPSEEAWDALGLGAHPVLRAGGTYLGEHQLRRKDGAVFWARLQGRLIDPADEAAGSIWCIEDVSEVKRLAARATQSERIAATATLAHGLAHEINNPLASVTSNLFFVEEQLAASAPGPGREGRLTPEQLAEVSQALADASHCADRIKEIVSDLRAFALGDRPGGSPSAALLEGVMDARRIAAQDLARCRSFEVDIPPLPEVALTRPDLVQLLAHLLINAGQATDHRPNDVRVAAEAAGPGRIRLVVRDTGMGLDETSRSRAFEPFFTTKKVGQGRGLGLSVCLGIVEAVGGTISLRSAPAAGTEVTVVLPTGAAPPA